MRTSYTLLYFLGKNCEKGVPVAQVNNKMAGLAFLFKLGGVEDVTKVFIVRKALKRGYRKGRGRPDTWGPVFLGMLVELSGGLPSVCFTPFETQIFRTAFVVAFLGH